MFGGSFVLVLSRYLGSQALVWDRNGLPACLLLHGFCDGDRVQSLLLIAIAMAWTLTNCDCLRLFVD